MGRSRAGGGLPGSGAYLPLQEEQVAAVRDWAPGFLCARAPARYGFPPELVGPPGPALTGPMAQTPDGISYELRGKR